MDRIGIDLVYIPEFQSRLRQSGGIEKVFTGPELAGNVKLESLAGIFAAKEAFMKAMGRKLNWRDIWIEKDSGGRPCIRSLALPYGNEAEVSISHAGEYAMAIVMMNEN